MAIMATKIAYDEATVSRTDYREGDDASCNVPRLSDRSADESYKLFSKVQVADPTPEEARRIRNKLLWRILPFLCVGYHLMYVDKQTVCQNARDFARPTKLTADMLVYSSEVRQSLESWKMQN